MVATCVLPLRPSRFISICSRWSAPNPIPDCPSSPHPPSSTCTLEASSTLPHPTHPEEKAPRRRQAIATSSTTCRRLDYSTLPWITATRHRGTPPRGRGRRLSILRGLRFPPALATVPCMGVIFMSCPRLRRDMPPAVLETIIPARRRPRPLPMQSPKTPSPAAQA